MILEVAPSGGGDSCYDIGDDCSNGNEGGGDDNDEWWWQLVMLVIIIVTLCSKFVLNFDFVD